MMRFPPYSPPFTPPNRGWQGGAYLAFTLIELSGRDYHSSHKGNPAFRFEAGVKPDRVSWQPYPGLPGVTAGVPGVVAITNGSYRHQPHWYYNFLYADERARGLDCEEDLAAPGVFQWNCFRRAPETGV